MNQLLEPQPDINKPSLNIKPQFNEILQWHNKFAISANGNHQTNYRFHLMIEELVEVLRLKQGWGNEKMYFDQLDKNGKSNKPAKELCRLDIPPLSFAYVEHWI